MQTASYRPTALVNSPEHANQSLRSLISQLIKRSRLQRAYPRQYLFYRLHKLPRFQPRSQAQSSPTVAKDPEELGEDSEEPRF